MDAIKPLTYGSLILTVLTGIAFRQLWLHQHPGVMEAGRKQLPIELEFKTQLSLITNYCINWQALILLFASAYVFLQWGLQALRLFVTKVVLRVLGAQLAFLLVFNT